MTSISSSTESASESSARIRVAASVGEIFPSATICRIFFRSSDDIIFRLLMQPAIAQPARQLFFSLPAFLKSPYAHLPKLVQTEGKEELVRLSGQDPNSMAPLTNHASHDAYAV